MKPGRLGRIEARIAALEELSVPARRLRDQELLQKAIIAALKSGRHGHVMTESGYPVRLLAGDVRHEKSLLGVLLYPMGHELPESWYGDGRFPGRRDGQKSLCILAMDRLDEAFGRYGKRALREVGL